MDTSVDQLFKEPAAQPQQQQQQHQQQQQINSTTSQHLQKLSTTTIPEEVTGKKVVTVIGSPLGGVLSILQKGMYF